MNIQQNKFLLWIKPGPPSGAETLWGGACARIFNRIGTAE